MCLCEANWAGARCELFNGVCDPVCNGCTGPDSINCSSCVEHAFRTGNGCECDPEWDGASCDNYIGHCADTCQHGFCDGPTEFDCTKCVDNAEKYWDGKCICTEGWAGHLCELYQGKCDPICSNTCVGPTTYDCCGICVTNASLNADMGCECNSNWEGPACDLFAGICNPICVSCNGTTSSDCNECVPNAGRDSGGLLCICMLEYGGSDCTGYTSGCYPTCKVNKCTGHTIYDCFECREHAYMNEFNECVCEKDWTGKPDCS
jgi:hypothetical protein